MQPQLGGLPATAHSNLGDPEHPGDLRDCQASEISELDDAALLRIEGRQSAERVVQRDEIDVLVGDRASDVVQQIKQLQQDSRNAQMKNDVSWAQQHLADGFMAGNSWGDWETKDDFVKDLQNKTNKWKSGNISDVQVATFGSNTAVSHYTFTYDAELKGTHRARTVICSDTWVNDSGTWKTASTHCSLVKGK